MRRCPASTRDPRPGRPRRAGQRFRPRLPRRTIRLRLAALFLAVFLASGAVLLAVTLAVWQGRTTDLVAHAVPVPAGSGPVVGSGITEHSSDRHQLLIASAIALAVMAAVSLAVGWLVAGRFLRPLRTITATTREISATNLHERLNLAGSPECERRSTSRWPNPDRCPRTSPRSPIGCAASSTTSTCC